MTKDGFASKALEIKGAIPLMALQLVDSSLLTTREFWRKKFFDATDDEARDPRPLREVIAERKEIGNV